MNLALMKIQWAALRQTPLLWTWTNTASQSNWSTNQANKVLVSHLGLYSTSSTTSMQLDWSKPAIICHPPYNQTYMAHWKDPEELGQPPVLNMSNLLSVKLGVLQSLKQTWKNRNMKHCLFSFAWIIPTWTTSPNLCLFCVSLFIFWTFSVHLYLLC